MRTCVQCGNPLKENAPKIRKFCSQPCYWESLHTRAVQKSHSQSFVDKFWSLVNIGSPDECWEWKKKPARSGYGAIGGTPWSGERNKRRLENAHRVSYRLTRGEIPQGMVVRHACDNKLCVNPNHLLIGTAMDNARDAVERDRTAFGERSGAAKLTAEDIRHIRQSPLQHTELAKIYGVHDTTILRARRAETWARCR